MANHKFADPNVSDPLSEPTLNRRLWAAYKALGMTRRDFARALDAGENLVTYWDTGKTTISLVYLIKAARVVGYSLDELVHGRSAEHMRSLSAEQIRTLLDDAGASYAQRDALSELMRTQPAEPLSAAYVRGFLRSFARAARDQVQHDAALKRAQRGARNAHETALAKAQGLQPLDYAVLRDTSSGTAKAPRKRAKVVARRPRERLPTSTPDTKR